MCSPNAVQDSGGWRRDAQTAAGYRRLEACWFNRPFGGPTLPTTRSRNRQAGSRGGIGIWILSSELDVGRKEGERATATVRGGGRTNGPSIRQAFSGFNHVGRVIRPPQLDLGPLSAANAPKCRPASHCAGHQTLQAMGLEWTGQSGQGRVGRAEWAARGDGLEMEWEQESTSSR